MKRFSVLIVMGVMGGIILLLSGCGSTTNLYPGGPTVSGLIYTDTTSPSQNLTVAVDKDAKAIKKGESSNKAFLGMFAFGNGGVDAAMKDGNITRVHHVDHSVHHFLFYLFVKDKTIVYGE
jgi:TRL (tRNA-associated locus)-like protein